MCEPISQYGGFMLPQETFFVCGTLRSLLVDSQINMWPFLNG